jgi:hypothetical protein
MANNIETFFLVTVNTDGTFTTYTEMPTEPIEATRPGTNFDVYQTCKAIADEFESQILTDRIVRALTEVLAPTTPSIPDAIRDALKERGIDPESNAPTA